MSKIKFQNKYRIESMRNQNWDYSWNGAYFVTFITKNRKHFFGEIQNSSMVLNEIGKIAMRFWFKIPIHYPFIKIDRFVIMPNHIHGILWIDNPKNNLVNDNKTDKNNGDLDININETLDNDVLLGNDIILGNDDILGNDRDKACLVSIHDQTTVRNPNDINDNHTSGLNNHDQTTVHNSNDNNSNQTTVRNPNDINDNHTSGLNNHDQTTVHNSNDNNSNQTTVRNPNDSNDNHTSGLNNHDQTTVHNSNDNNSNQTTVRNPNDSNDNHTSGLNNRDQTTVHNSNDNNSNQTTVHNPNDINDNHTSGFNNHDQTTVHNSNDSNHHINHLNNRMNFQNTGKQSLSTVIGSYKSVVTKNAKSFNANFAWQSGYHDQIIHNEDDLNRVRKYILNNPVNWNEYSK